MGAATGAQISEEALAVHRAATPIDLHADTPKLMSRGYDIRKRHEPPKKPPHPTAKFRHWL